MTSLDYSKWDALTLSSDDESNSAQMGHFNTGREDVEESVPKTRAKISKVVKNRIIDKIQYNRLTIIVGATGCG